MVLNRHHFRIGGAAGFEPGMAVLQTYAVRRQGAALQPDLVASVTQRSGQTDQAATT
jgi:hypothetical protein